MNFTSRLFTGNRTCVGVQRTRSYVLLLLVFLCLFSQAYTQWSFSKRPSDSEKLLFKQFSTYLGEYQSRILNATIPTIYQVTPNGSVCANDNVEIKLGASDIGISYQLKLNDLTDVGSALDGTGGELNFGAHTAPGNYTIVATDPSDGSSQVMDGTTVVIANPATPTATNDGPACEGGSVTLSTPQVVGATYSWTGPNGFASSDNAPLLSNLALADAGTYSVTITVNGCTSDAGTTDIVVNATPSAPTVSNDGPLCEASTLNLTTNAVAGAILFVDRT